MCDNCDRESTNSSFIFGLVIGAVIAAIVAVYIYKNKKSAVFQNLREKLEKYFSDFIGSSPQKHHSKTEKKSVVLPKNIETLDLKPVPKPKPAKMFRK